MNVSKINNTFSVLAASLCTIAILGCNSGAEIKAQPTSDISPNSGTNITEGLPAAPTRAITDAELLSDIVQPDTYNFYKNSEQWVPFAPGGGGHSGFIRLRFNTIAAGVLGPDGKLPVGGVFPEGSLIIKEISDTAQGVIEFIAVMKKVSTAQNANKDWVWGEYYADGDPLVSAAGAGGQCIRCHSFTSQTSNVPGDGGHRDYVRYFGLHD